MDRRVAVVPQISSFVMPGYPPDAIQTNLLQHIIRHIRRQGLQPFAVCASDTAAAGTRQLLTCAGMVAGSRVLTVQLHAAEDDTQEGVASSK